MKVTLVGSIGNLVLLTFKFLAGVLGHSAAMIADAAHSLSDFVTDVIVLAFVRIGARPQDASHDYGHGKFETLATFFVALALVAAAVGIIVSGAVKFAGWLQGETLSKPGAIALWAALISIVVKELLYRYTVSRGKALNSSVVVANAWHHRSDALSSVGAAIGIGGALLLGDRWAVLDPLASIVVGAMLVKVAWDLLKGSTGELTDSSLSEETEREVEDIICSFPQVSEPHNLRTRKIGNRVAIEVHVRMDGDMPLNKAHAIVSEMEHRLKDRFGRDSLVTIHMEPNKTEKEQP
ncbi:MAG: cation transporter [Bacteroidales bacterium]|nr:cation transporter [Bacteroidales bacterium]MBP5796147.1 cation transporter [Bacteroidales bacterium]